MFAPLTAMMVVEIRMRLAAARLAALRVTL